MSLFLATLLTGLTLLLAGAMLIWKTRAVAALAHSFPRSQPAAYFCMGLGSAWFLHTILTISESDAILPRPILFLIFIVIALLSFVYAREFLAVRGVAILMLLVAHVLLGAAFMQDPATRLFLVTLVYAGIISALYLGVAPYRLRDFFQWLFATRMRSRVFGAFFLGYGLLLKVVAITY